MNDSSHSPDGEPALTPPLNDRASHQSSVARARVSPLTRTSADKDFSTQKSLAPRRALCFTEELL